MKKKTHPLIIALMIVLAFTFYYPFHYILVLSFNDAYDAYKGGLWLLPREFTIENFKVLFNNPYLFQSFGITVARVLIMAVIVPFLCSMYGYGLTFRQLIGRKFFSLYIIIPMYVSGGVIPFYTVLRKLHLVDTFMVFIIPYMMVPFYILLFRSYFQDRVDVLREAAIVDGATQFRIYTSIVIPTSLPVVAVVALYTAVANWNEWYVGQAFVTRSELWPLQTVMLQVIKSQQMKFAGLSSSIIDKQSKVTPEAVRMAMIVTCVVPILCIYPFLQRYFIHGIMIGAVKE